MPFSSYKVVRFYVVWFLSLAFSLYEGAWLRVSEWFGHERNLCCIDQLLLLLLLLLLLRSSRDAFPRGGYKT